VDGACALTANMYRSPTRKSAGCVQPDAAATQSAASTSAAWCTTVTSVISIAVRSTAAGNLFLPLVPGPGTHSVRATATALSVCFSFSRRAEAEHRANVMHEWPRCLRRGRGAESAGRGGREARSRAHRGEEAADGERKGGRMDAGADVGVGQGPRWCPACPLWLSRTVSRADRTPSSGRDVGIIITHRTLRWFVRFGHGRRSDDEKY
jgi:hypothetical protein